jgi:hypothetical protein
MGIVGGWYMVAVIAAVAGFFAMEVFKAMRGDVDLSPRQKVVRILGGAMAMGVLAMIALSRDATHGKTRAFDLLYWLAALGLGIGVMLMGVLDMAEVSRQFVRGSRDLRKGTVTEEDARRLLEEQSRRDRNGPKE